MRNSILLIVLLFLVAAFGADCLENKENIAIGEPPTENGIIVSLPQPRHASDISIEEALLLRRSVRSYTTGPVSLVEIGQILWAAQGITDREGHRTAPSAGSLYPLEIYVVAGDVNGLVPGVYRYLPENHQLVRMIEGDVRDAMSAAALDQSSVKIASADIVISAVPERTTVRYGDRGMRYIFMEAGHVAQNVYLQATAIDLGTVAVGAFNDTEVRDILHMQGTEMPVYIMPLGKK